MYQPLADLLRPTTLDEVFGQDHILAPGAVLRRLIDSGNVPNMVFYGPSGTGKTTVANIIAQKTNRKLCKLNATTASTADIKEIVSQLDTFLAPNGILLYLDEIQSFNKKQQQSLLEFIENGKITLIASTTENPYFYVFNAILSRSTIFEFKQIDAGAALKAVKRAVSFMEERTGLTAAPESGALEYIAGAVGGDLRKAINAVEVLFSAGIPQGDKLLTIACMCMMCEWGMMPAWALMIVLTREFAVTGLRLVAVQNGTVIAAGWSGKVKTASTMVGLCFVMAFPTAGWIVTIVNWMIVITTLYSGIEYFVQNWKCLGLSK